jgi:hypothetical protein
MSKLLAGLFTFAAVTLMSAVAKAQDTGGVSNADNVTPTGTGLYARTQNFNYCFDGTNWDRCGGVATQPAGGTSSEFIAVQGDPLGVPIPVDTIGRRATYAFAMAGLAPGSTATDIFCIYGSSTKTVRVLQMSVTGIATSATAANLLVNRYAATNSGGSPTSQPPVKLDDNNLTASATLTSYTGMVTSTPVGTLDARKLTLGTASSAEQIVPATFDFSASQGLVLRGTSQGACLNWAGQTITGNSLNVSIRFTEE